MTEPAAESIDVVELGQTIRRGWRTLALCTVLGMLLGVAVLLFGPRWFTGSASIVVRQTPTGGASSILSRLGLGDAAPGLGAASPIETEIAILSSRALVERVVDSLKLQVAVKSPKSVASRDLIGVVKAPGAFRDAKYHVERVSGSQYRVSTKDKQYTAQAGAPVTLPEGVIVLRADTTLPAQFDIRLLDREDAIAGTVKHLSVGKTGGEVLSVAFQAPDSMTAAAVPNALVGEYFARRHTTDRGTNEYRVGFLTAQVDSVGRQLRVAEDSLRRFQEATGVLQPELQGKIQLDRAADIRKEMGAVDVERGAIGQLIAQVTSGQVSPRQLAAYPSFLRAPGINELLGQLVKIETDRSQLLERRLENDQEVVALTRAAKNIEEQLMTLAAGYKSTLERQRTDLTSQLDTIRSALGVFPGAVESSGRLQRRAKELAQTYTVLQAQLVEARLAAIGEGGEVHRLDIASPPRKVAFPKLATTVGIGTGAGLFVGLVLAIGVGFLGRYVEDPMVIERTTGVPALRLDTGVPLLMAGPRVSNTVLLLPLDARTSTEGVAERLARTATARAIQPAVLDLSGTGLLPSASLTTDVNARIQHLEQEHGMVIVRLPVLATEEAAAALTPERVVLLVAPSGRIERRLLASTIQTLRRIDVHCAGVVVNRAVDGVLV